MVTQLVVTVFFSAGHFLDLLECNITLFHFGGQITAFKIILIKEIIVLGMLMSQLF